MIVSIAKRPAQQWYSVTVEIDSDDISFIVVCEAETLSYDRAANGGVQLVRKHD